MSADHVDPAPTRDGDLISTTEATTILGCSISTVHRLIVAGTLVPAFTMPGDRPARILHRADVDRLAHNRRHPGSP